MKYIVDSLPKTQKDCDHSKWEPFIDRVLIM